MRSGPGVRVGSAMMRARKWWDLENFSAYQTSSRDLAAIHYFSCHLGFSFTSIKIRSITRGAGSTHEDDDPKPRTYLNKYSTLARHIIIINHNGLEYASPGQLASQASNRHQHKTSLKERILAKIHRQSKRERSRETKKARASESDQKGK